MIALCEKDRKDNLQRLLEIVDITKVSSPRLLTNIFGFLGRSLLESMAMKFLRELQMCGEGEYKSTEITSRCFTVSEMNILCILDVDSSYNNILNPLR